MTNLGWKSVWSANMFIIALTMQILCIADAERVAIMKKLTLEEAVKVLEDMKVNIALPKAAELQHKRNEAIDMVIEALNSSEIPNNSDSVLSAEPEPLSQAYARTVWTWLLNYQIKSEELKGTYSPYEVLSWVTNDWRKENGLDK